MSCEECLPLLEEHADGELGPREAARVEAHTEACASCARARRRLEDERAVFLAYECDAAPAEGFWDELLSKIEAVPPAGSASAREGSTRAPRGSWAAGARARFGAALGALAAPRLSPALVAALLLVAVGATVALMKYAGDTKGVGSASPSSSSLSNRGGAADERAAGESRPSVGDGREVVREVAGGRARDAEKSSKSPGKSARGSVEKSVRVKSAATTMTPPSQENAAAPERLVREAEEKYLAAIRLLSRDVSGRRARLDADARARFEQTLAAVDRSIADTRRAAREHPRDPVAVQYMLTAYAKKVEVLREMARH